MMDFPNIVLLIYFITALFLGTLAENECANDKDCLINNSVCEKNTCVCPPDFVFNSERTECLKVSHGYGAPCSDSLQCSASLEAGGSCNDGKCECVKGYHYFKGQCWKTAGLGDACVDNNNCFVSNDFESSICNAQKECTCSVGYYQREYSSCRKISNNPGDPCGIALDCKFENAICTRDRICAINNGTEVTTDQVEMHLFDLWREKRAIFSYKITDIVGNKIGEDCKEDSDCPQNAQCYEESICLCKKGYYTNDTSTTSTCYPELGESCTEDNDCKGKNTMCRDSKYCTCKVGFVSSLDSTYCDKLSRNLNWSCLRDEECGFFGPGGKCISKKCLCSNDTHWVQKQLFCWITKKVGESCANKEDCGGNENNMICSEDQKCTCVNGTHKSTSGESCNKDSKKVGEVCNENIDCIYDYAECNTTAHRCTCQKGYLEKSDGCVPGITGACKNDKDCSVENSYCLNNACTCVNDTVQSNSLAKCLPVATIIGVSCEESLQCNLKISGDCINNICSCLNGSGFVYEANKCFVQRGISQYCKGKYDCYMSHTECQNHHCVCKRGYPPNRNQTRCKGLKQLPYDLTLIVCTLLALVGFTFNRI